MKILNAGDIVSTVLYVGLEGELLPEIAPPRCVVAFSPGSYTSHSGTLSYRIKRDLTKRIPSNIYEKRPEDVGFLVATTLQEAYKNQPHYVALLKDVPPKYHHVFRVTDEGQGNLILIDPRTEMIFE